MNQRARRMTSTSFERGLSCSEIADDMMYERRERKTAVAPGCGAARARRGINIEARCERTVGRRCRALPSKKAFRSAGAPPHGAAAQRDLRVMQTLAVPLVAGLPNRHANIIAWTSRPCARNRMKKTRHCASSTTVRPRSSPPGCSAADDRTFHHTQARRRTANFFRAVCVAQLLVGNTNVHRYKTIRALSRSPSQLSYDPATARWSS